MKNVLKFTKYTLYMLLMQLRGFKYWTIKKLHGNSAASDYVQKIIYLWSKFTLNIIGIELEVHGEENLLNIPCVYISNHSSILDIPILFYTSRKKIGFIAKRELLKVPIIGFWLKRSGSISIDRENPRDAVRCIKECQNNLNNGYCITVFPEGTRNKAGQVSPFKKGAFKFATKTKAPIIPVAIEHASRSFEDKKKFVPSKIKVFFNKPIYTENLTKNEEQVLHDHVRNIILNNLNLK